MNIKTLFSTVIVSGILGFLAVSGATAANAVNTPDLTSSTPLIANVESVTGGDWE